MKCLPTLHQLGLEELLPNIKHARDMIFFFLFCQEVYMIKYTCTFHLIM